MYSPKADVLVSIPGTPQAKEAVIANSIPQTATITRASATLKVTYEGAPVFQPIAGTNMTYAANSAIPVIYVPGNTYYAVNNGVWFTSAVATGPWAVATSVPSVIYTIPPSSPVHYVTYVQVYGYTPSVVYVGYTPGYYGTVVSTDGVVVYGTGYYYPPYIGPTGVGAGALHVWRGRDVRLEHHGGMGAGLWHGYGYRLVVQPVVGTRRLLGLGLGSSCVGLGRMGRCRRSQCLWPMGQHYLRWDARGLGESLDRYTSVPALAGPTITRSPATAATLRTEKTTTPTPATTQPAHA